MIQFLFVFILILSCLCLDAKSIKNKEPSSLKRTPLSNIIVKKERHPENGKKLRLRRLEIKKARASLRKKKYI